MQLELVDEEEMASRSKRPIEPRKGSEIKTTYKSKTGDTKDERSSGGSGGSGGSGSPGSPVGPSGSNTPGAKANIVKRMYFPGDKYSQKENQKEFKKILATHGLSWVRSKMKSYSRKDGTALLTGMYASNDGNKKVFCIYEGTNKPMTAVIKLMGSGGLFLIDLNSFCNKIGCIIEDKDEAYANNILLTLQEKGEIYVENKMEKVETKSIEEIQKEYEEKIEKRINESVEEYIRVHRFVYDTYCESLFWKRGLSEAFIRKFRRLEVEKDIRWAVENGY